MNNIAQLTAGNAVYAQKRAKKRTRIEEVTFDSESRRYLQLNYPSNGWDFLTGFHKRKAQRQKKAAEFAFEQARKERIEARKEVYMLF
jgi:ribosomal RNA-processing protein 17